MLDYTIEDFEKWGPYLVVDTTDGMFIIKGVKKDTPDDVKKEVGNYLKQQQCMQNRMADNWTPDEDD